MGGRGPVPQERRSRDRDTRPLTDLSVPKRPKTYHPFPAKYGPPGEEITCLPITKRHWETWRTSAQAQAFTATEWLRLEDLVPLWDQYARTSDHKIMAEIRLNEAKLGATPEDRLRTRMRIGDPATADRKPVRKRPAGDPRKTAS